MFNIQILNASISNINSRKSIHWIRKSIRGCLSLLGPTQCIQRAPWSCRHRSPALANDQMIKLQLKWWFSRLVIVPLDHFDENRGPILQGLREDLEKLAWSQKPSKSSSGWSMAPTGDHQQHHYYIIIIIIIISSSLSEWNIAPAGDIHCRRSRSEFSASGSRQCLLSPWTTKYDVKLLQFRQL